MQVYRPAHVLGKPIVPTTLQLSAFAIEEVERPRPHYQVNLRGAITALCGVSDPTAGLLPEEVVMTVRLPTDIGSDLKVIREAAEKRALTLLETLIDRQSQAPTTTSEAMPAGDAVSVGIK